MFASRRASLTPKAEYSTKCIYFDGTADKIDVPHHANFDHQIGGTYSAFSWSFWMQSHTHTMQWLITKKKTSPAANDYQIGIYPGSGSRGVLYAYPVNGGVLRTISATKTTIDLWNRTWRHIVFTYDGSESNASDRPKFYVDGELMNMGGTGLPNSPALIDQDDADIAFGVSASDSSTYEFQGFMNEICYFKNIALSQSDVNLLYNDGTPIDATNVRTDTTKVYWRLGEDGDTTGTDGINEVYGNCPGTLGNIQASQIVDYDPEDNTAPVV